jgi:RNA polymerase sigma-70 factor (ECF subfamily)
MMSNNNERNYMIAGESELVQWAREGDKLAFGELYQQYVNRIYNYFYYRTGSQPDAEDLTTRVFIRALSHIKNYDERGVPFSAWLYRIAHNLIANWHRDNSRRKVIPLDDYLANQLQTDAPEVVTEQREEEEHLLASIRQLPAERQHLLFLKFVERLSNAEIGTIMNRTEGAIKSLYHRTLSSLHDDLIGRGFGPLKAIGQKRQKRLKQSDT